MRRIACLLALVFLALAPLVVARSSASQLSLVAVHLMLALLHVVV